MPILTIQDIRNGKTKFENSVLKSYTGPSKLALNTKTLFYVLLKYLPWNIISFIRDRYQLSITLYEFTWHMYTRKQSEHVM